MAGFLWIILRRGWKDPKTPRTLRTAAEFAQKGPTTKGSSAHSAACLGALRFLRTAIAALTLATQGLLLHNARMKNAWKHVALLVVISSLAQAQSSKRIPCESLSQIALPEAKVGSAESLQAGAFPAPPNLPPWLAGEPAFYKTLPAFCRVQVQGKPSADSDIRIEVWMPNDWNGKLQGIGNGGFAGQLDYHNMAVAISHGYAAVATDTGHTGEAIDARWALNHPEKIKDFGYRAIHQMTLVAKASAAAFYGKAPQHSYFAGCSNGGRQALMEAQRFPDDYDGILAGAPANYWTHLLASALWDAQATAMDGASYIPAAKLPAIAKAVNAACDAQDGVSDGVLNDPRQCRLDPASLLCKTENTDACLTVPQAAALKKLYDGAHDTTGQVFPGFLPGAEAGPGGWGLWITGQEPGRSLLFAFGYGFFADMVYEDPQWSFKTADFGQAVKDADKKAETFNATDPDLSRFMKHGSKLIVYHGWNDPAISAVNSVDYFNSVEKAMDARNADSFLRLYMAPGVQHCSGGPGPDSFDEAMQSALELWVEKNNAPAEIVATKYEGEGAAKTVKATRPLCPYPQAAKYKGSGDTNQAASFVCAGK